MAKEDHDPSLELPSEPIDRLIKPIERFMHVEAAGGLLLLACTIAALVLANSGVSGSYLGFWKTEFGFRFGSIEMIHSLKHWINDGLMAVFFFVIGLEVKREIVVGELRDFRRASLPVAAAIGGMVVPAGIYLAMQFGQPAQDGWGIPMATDIAFVVGCMAILGRRVPGSFRVMVLSLAIADDIGAILVIAIGYTASINFYALVSAFAGLVLIYLLLRLGLRSFLAYAIIGIGVWLGFHESGVHATIAGVLLGLLTPTRARVSEGHLQHALGRVRDIVQGEAWSRTPNRASKARKVALLTRESVSPVEYIERMLHPWVSFLIMPVFALANAGVEVHLADVVAPTALAVSAGLLIGKPVGIVAASWLAVRTGMAKLPRGVGWPVMLAGGFLAGIGFTMALFIAGLALEGDLLGKAKVGILTASLLAALTGMLLLWIFLEKPRAEDGQAAAGH